MEDSLVGEEPGIALRTFLSSLLMIDEDSDTYISGCKCVFLYIIVCLVVYIAAYIFGILIFAAVAWLCECFILSVVARDFIICPLLGSGVFVFVLLVQTMCMEIRQIMLLDIVAYKVLQGEDIDEGAQGDQRSYAMLAV